MLSQSAEYVLRVVVYLAAQGGKPCTTHQIAQATHVPEGYLSKLLQSLGRAGFVDSQRGLHGGFVLTRRPEEMTVYDVVQVVSPPQRIRSCPLGIPSHRGQLCPLHRRLDQALELVENSFRQSTIAEMMGELDPNRPFCEGPVAGEPAPPSRGRRKGAAFRRS